MLTTFLPIIYFVALALFLFQLFRVILKIYASPTSNAKQSSPVNDDRTGLLTVHPELLTKEGQITDEDLLTVRFSNDLDPPKSAETSSDE